ncbi:hypothetical protein [Streptomyces sp. KR55]|uniref:hypothetical protein n=1 Tax=Streptomyces sp. KR55 TaxID=3457425 RepID=UPI003FD54173
MSVQITPWPGAPIDAEEARPPYEAPGDDDRLGRRLEAAVAAADGPDVVFAASRHGRRIVRCGGTAPPPSPRSTPAASPRQAPSEPPHATC